jgi:nucleotidyltransferase/DNA polymerase involved in DNA repair
MPPDYSFDWNPNQVATAVLSKSSWAVLALTLRIELFTQSHYRESIREDVDLSELGLPISVGVARTKHLAKIASQVAKPDGLVVVDPDTELEFLQDLPVELMWGVGPVTKARLAEIGVVTIGQLAKTPGWSLARLLGPAGGEKLAALAWNRDPREIKTHQRARSAGAQSAIGRKPAEERIFRSCFILQIESARVFGASPRLVEP